MQDPVRNIALCIAAAASLSQIALAADEAGGDRPNIIFILADDLGFNQLGCYGETPIKTPNLDRLAARGVRVTQAYAGNTVCSPSRVSLFTGRDGRLMENNSNTVQLKEIDVTFAHVLKHAGYDTALFGKYSIGSQMGVTDPLAMGFDTWFVRYLKWLLTSEYGRLESTRSNNHATWYDFQVGAILLFLGKDAEARELLESVKTNRIVTQIEPDGRQPHELARTKSLSYSRMNLSAFTRLAQLGEKVGVDLMNYETPDGRSIRNAEAFLSPYLRGEKR